MTNDQVQPLRRDDAPGGGPAQPAYASYPQGRPVEPTNAQLAGGDLDDMRPYTPPADAPPARNASRDARDRAGISRGGIVAAVVAGLLGALVVGLGIVGISRASTSITRDRVMVVDGHASVAMESGEARSLVASAVGEIPAATCQVTGPAGRVGLIPNNFESTSNNVRSYQIGTFEASSPGTYDVACNNVVTSAWLARPISSSLFIGSILGTIAGAFLLLGGPIVALTLGRSLRRRPGGDGRDAGRGGRVQSW